MLWPVVVVATTLGFAAGFARGSLEASLALVPLAAGVLLFGLELALPERRGGGAWRDPQAWNDLAHNLVGQGGGNALGQALFVFGAAWLAGEVSRRFGANLWPAQWPWWAQVPLLVFVADGLDYARHRAEHRVRWLWPIHALHHDVDRLNVLKSGRGHFLDMVFRCLVCYAPLALVGVPRDVLLTYAAAVTVFGPIAHANVAVPVPAWLHRWLLTPQVHRIHHARPLHLSCSNYANVFPVWDRLCGTFEAPEAHAADGCEYGVEEGAQPADFWGQTLAPFAAWRRSTPERARISSTGPSHAS